MTILVTGVAGFIGMHTALRLLEDGNEVVGIDCLNDYYDPQLKKDRLSLLLSSSNFSFLQLDICDQTAFSDLFDSNAFAKVVHLAAQAGVRHSLEYPHEYAQSNLVGFLNVLEGCRRHDVSHLIYASSSSVYGGNVKQPYSETDTVDRPMSLYAATKKANELMAYSYSHLYRLPTTGLRFFTVYGPWGRPDMAYFRFVKAILEQQPIDVFNYGDMRRDFTYIDDIVEGVVRVVNRAPLKTLQASPPADIFNIGNHTPVPLLDFIGHIERALGRESVKRLLPMQPGDVPTTFADVSKLEDWVGFKPETPLAVGVDAFVAWYLDYYKV